MNRVIDIAAVKAANRIEDLAAHYGVALKRAGRELVGLSPFQAERTPSFYVDPRKQVFKCFASGEGGDVIELVRRMEGLGFREALERLASKACLENHARSAALTEQRRVEQARIETEERSDKRRKIKRSLSIWHSCQPAGGSLAERYLRNRCIDLDAIAKVYGHAIPTSLRFHPALDYYYAGVRHCGPAMVGALVDAGGTFTGVHRTWLEARGRGKAHLPKAKLCLGVVWGSMGLLSHPADYAIAGEGYETTLSVMGELAAQGRHAFFFSALSLGNLTGGGMTAVPEPGRAGLLLPRCVKHFLMLGDSDGKDPAKTRAMLDNGAIKFSQVQGIEVRIAMAAPGCDFNDMVRMAAA